MKRIETVLQLSFEPEKDVNRLQYPRNETKKRQTIFTRIRRTCIDLRSKPAPSKVHSGWNKRIQILYILNFSFHWQRKIIIIIIEHYLIALTLSGSTEMGEMIHIK